MHFFPILTSKCAYRPCASVWCCLYLFRRHPIVAADGIASYPVLLLSERRRHFSRELIAPYCFPLDRKKHTTNNPSTTKTSKPIQPNTSLFFVLALTSSHVFIPTFLLSTSSERCSDTFRQKNTKKNYRTHAKHRSTGGMVYLGLQVVHAWQIERRIKCDLNLLHVSPPPP